MWDKLKRRKIVQWGLAYLAGAWVALQLVSILAGQFGWSGWIERGVTILLAFGFFVALVVAWYHGEKGRQRVSGPELLMVAGILVVAGAAIALVRGEPADEADVPSDPPGAQTATRKGSTGGPEEGADLPLSVSERSVAVLPFENLSPDTANAYFAYGVHDAVITALANLGDLTVTSRTSVMQYDESAADVRTVAAELGVTHVVEGTVQRAGDRVRATVQLIDARTDRHLWADHFEREVSPEALFAIQSEIAEEVAGALQASLSPEERLRIERQPTENLEAWELFTRARHLARTSEYSPQLAERVYGMLRRAAELDPDFALPHAQLAMLYENEWSRTVDDRWLDSSRTAARRALEIDPSLPEGHLAMAEYQNAVGDLEAEREATLRALELRPNDGDALARLSRLEASGKRLDRAVCVARRAVEVAPTEDDGYRRLANAYRDLGFFARAERAYRQELDVRPGSTSPYSNLVRVSLAQGDRRRALEYYRARRAAGDSTGSDLEEIAAIEWHLGWVDSARVHFQRAEELGSRRWLFDVYRAATLWESGDREGAEEVLEGMEERGRTLLKSGGPFFFPHLNLMSVYLIRGETESAVDWLEEAVEAGFHILPWLEPGLRFGSLPGVEQLREDERYREIEARLSAAQDSMRAIVEERGC